MHIGIFGGSFNPIHYGHIGLAEWIVQHTELEEVWLMVSPSNPLKDPNLLANDQERWKAVVEAVEGHEHLVASDIEMHLPRPSYTIQTLQYLEEHFPSHSFSLIIGEDNLAIIQQWKEWEYILDHYVIWVYPRKGKPVPTPARGRIIRLQDAPQFDISSTEIRNGEKESGIKMNI